MSIQLIVYPQNYNGQYNVISLGAVNNLVSDSQVFATANGGATAVYLNYVLSDIGLATTPAYGVWQKYKISGMVQGPFVSGTNLNIPGELGADGSGVYQRITGLNIGTSYEINLNFANSTGGLLTIAVYDGATLTQVNYRVTNTAAILPVYFTATNTNHTLILHYDDDVSGASDVCQISGLTLFEQGQETFLEDGQVILDLYADEDIPLTLSVDDFKNAAEKVQSYSKAFKVPATKRNNRIFDNIFEITRADDGIVFNPYRKTQSLLKQDGFTVFEGYLRLIEITDKNGEISYNINLYSEAVALADVLKDKTFNDLDLSELNGTYTYANIRNSWQGQWALTNPLPANTVAGTGGDTDTNVIKYPFVDWAHGYIVDATTGMPILPTVQSTFRPFIRIKYLIERIFNPYTGPAFPFRYTSAFFDSADFGNLFMDFNWGESQTPQIFDASGDVAIVSDLLINTTSFNAIPFKEYSQFVNLNALPVLPPEIGYDSATGIFTPITANQTFTFTYGFDIDNVIFFTPSVDIEWLITRASGSLEIIDPMSYATISSAVTYSGAFNCTLDTGDTLICRVRLSIGGSAAEIKDTSSGFLLWDPAVTISTVMSETTSSGLLQTLRGEMGQWEFLKGIMTMFNLVAIPDKSDKNNLIIEPYKDIFTHQDFGTTLADRRILHDWTEKIDLTQIKLKPLTNLNKKTIFKFAEDDDDYAFNVYKQSVQGHLYGSKVYDASGFTILAGTEEIVAEPFAATFVKPLMTQYPNFIVPTIYSYNPDDGTSEAFDNAPRIMYDNGVKTLPTTTYHVPPSNGDSGDAFEDEYLCFSHLNPMPGILGGTDFHFGECQLAPGVGVSPVDNLFNTYWLPYYAQLYNPNTRIMSLKVNLTAGDISKFNMYDTVMIKNREFRVNKINYKPNDLATVEFILVS